MLNMSFLNAHVICNDEKIDGSIKILKSKVPRYFIGLKDTSNSANVHCSANPKSRMKFEIFYNVLSRCNK